ncbi:hypothetical protein [Kitasatospora sp. NPDC101183]|uniref:hypothetical protein n=1 Tax=Kitasatospora sp. NPDC101183 TaxID=3364100 RepID=UPI003812394E
MALSRGSAIRGFFTDLGTALSCTFEVTYLDGSRRWEAVWQDGPVLARVRESVGRALPQYTGSIGLRRDYTPVATALGALRAYRTGVLGKHPSGAAPWVPADLGRRLLMHVPDPLSTATGEELALIGHLLAEGADLGRALELLGGRPSDR